MVNTGALLRKYVKASLLESRSVLEEIPVCNFTSIDDFSNWLQKNAEKISAIQAQFQKINDEYNRQFNDYITLYHGAPIPAVESIKNAGFQLKKGRRQGFMGLTKEVNNLAIFLSDGKALAKAFGDNRSDYNNAGVLEVKAKLQHILDMKTWGKQIPLSLRRLMLKSLSDYEEQEIRKPKQEDMFWLIDQPEIVNEIRKLGFDSVVFSESTATKKAFGLNKSAGDTYAVFDTSRLVVYNPPIKNSLQSMFQYLKSTCN